jgi:hypothetical protein
MKPQMRCSRWSQHSNFGPERPDVHTAQLPLKGVPNAYGFVQFMVPSCVFGGVYTVGGVYMFVFARVRTHIHSSMHQDIDLHIHSIPDIRTDCMARSYCKQCVFHTQIHAHLAHECSYNCHFTQVISLHTSH